MLIEAENSDEYDYSFPYRSALGSLMYAATSTRPDISAAVGIVSRFLEKPKLIHCNMVKQIFYYLRYTSSKGLFYGIKPNVSLIGYSDASWANNEDYRSISGTAFLLGSSLISWTSKKQDSTALSSTESEYIALTSAVQDALWFSELMNELEFKREPITIYEDNEACINMSKNPQEFKRTRHIQVRYHFIRDHVHSGDVDIAHVRTTDQLADLFTKGMNSRRLNDLTAKLGMYEPSEHGRELNYAPSGCILRRNCRGSVKL
jgi:hypothetical protein